MSDVDLMEGAEPTGPEVEVCSDNKPASPLPPASSADGYPPQTHIGGGPPFIPSHVMQPPFPPPPAPVLLPQLRELTAPKPPTPDPPKQSDGPGFPYPVGGYAHGKAVRNPLWYKKTEDYQQEMLQAELRATFQLSYIYLYDSNADVAHFVDSLEEQDIILVSEGDDSAKAVARSIFELNVLKHTRVSPEELSQMDINPTSQIIIITDSTPDSTISDASLEKLRNFVSSGGSLLSFNTGVCLLDKLFPKKLTYKRGASSVDKPVEIEVLAAQDRALFDRYVHEIKQFKQLVRRKGMMRFDVVDPSVETLLRETAPDSGRPLAAKFQHGRGEVFQLNTTHLASKVGAQGGSNFLGLSDMLDAPSKKLALQTINDISTTPGKKLTTTSVAWRAAYNSGLYNALNMARSYVLTLDFMFELLRKYLRK